MTNFGWSYPAGCTDNDIDRHFGVRDDEKEDDSTPIGYMTEKGDLCLRCIDKVYGDDNSVEQECAPWTLGIDGKSGVTCHHCRKEMLKVYQELI